MKKFILKAEIHCTEKGYAVLKSELEGVPDTLQDDKGWLLYRIASVCDTNDGVEVVDIDLEEQKDGAMI